MFIFLPSIGLLITLPIALVGCKCCSRKSSTSKTKYQNTHHNNRSNQQHQEADNEDYEHDGAKGKKKVRFHPKVKVYYYTVSNTNMKPIRRKTSPSVVPQAPIG